MISLLLTLAIFTVAGAATALVLRLPLPRSRFAFLFLLGLGAHGTLLYALGAVGVPIDVPVMIAIPLLSLMVLFGALASRRLSGRRLGAVLVLDERRDAARSAGATPALLLFLIPLLILLYSATTTPTRDYDGRVTWLPKARAIALEHSLTGPFFHGQRGINLHNRYPLLLPLDAATLMRLTGDTRNETARWLYVLIPIAALLVMRAMVDPWIAAIAAWLPVMTAVEGGALAAYNDFALAAFAGVAVLYLIEALHDARAVRVAGVFAAFAVMTKNEGAVLAMALVIAAIAIRRWKWLRMLIPIAIAEAIVVLWRWQVPAAYDEQYEALLSSLPRNLGRMPEALLAIVRHAGDFSQWGVFWIAVAIAAIVVMVRERSARVAIPLVMIAVTVGAYVIALTVTSWSIADLAPVAVNRLLSQLIIPAGCILHFVIDKR